MPSDQTNDQMPPTDPAQWQIECEMAVFLAAFLLRLTARSYSNSAVTEVLRTIPQCFSEPTDHEVSGLFFRLFMEADSMNDWESENYAYFRRCVYAYMKLSAPRRVMIQASAIGSLLGAGMG